MLSRTDGHEGYSCSRGGRLDVLRSAAECREKRECGRGCLFGNHPSVLQCCSQLVAARLVGVERHRQLRRIVRPRTLLIEKAEARKFCAKEPLEFLCTRDYSLEAFGTAHRKVTL